MAAGGDCVCEGGIVMVGDPCLAVAVTVLGGMGIWALKAYIQQRTTLPKAQNGFLTLNELEKHCRNSQNQCLARLTQKIDTIEHLFGEHTNRLQEIEKNLVGMMEKFGQFEKEFYDRIIFILTNQQK